MIDISTKLVALLKLLNEKEKIGTSNKDNTNEPTEPEIVLFGLILLNFLPLKVLPKMKPPTSEHIQIENK